ncbi:DNA polymerase III subunit alpha [Candidatus Kaiserbacteria bacterium]|nr:DNA polymerase III subunit alpha [Candidatus Kaiserbacteria bacterium]
MEQSRFVHLHTHSHYSLLEALPKIPELVKAAKDDGETALALTDNGNMYGAIEFYKECKEQGIKPILGVDFFVAPRTRHDKEYRTDDHPSRLVLLAKNEAGYHNLIYLVTKSYLEGFYLRPRIDRELIETYREGLICILPTDADSSRDSFSWHKKIFADDCYAEITCHPEIEGHEEKIKKILKLSHAEHIETVATQNVYYMKQDDATARELVVKIKNGSALSREGDENLPDFSFKTQTEMKKVFADMPQAYKNAAKIADACTLELALGKAIFPSFPIPAGSSDDAELRKLAQAGIPERGLADTSELRTRMDYELGIIQTKGYASYFLIVADLLRHAREVGIITNTRGSAAGSLVSYLCGITTVDPIAFQMPFERFLNPERPSAPDIDMDIADNRRDELIEYARTKYGSDTVVQIGTFGTMLARAAVRDVSRALGHSYGTGDAIAKMIPFGKQGFPVTIESAMESTPELETAYKKDPVAREILDTARKVEGNARHVGVHAAGVVMAPRPVVEYAPIQLDPKGGKTITQYDMYSIADEYGGVGLLKFDFLGLTNLSILADARDRVKARLGIEVDLDRLPMDDTKVYAMLTRGETLGVFQMAGSGMTAYLKDLQPTVIHDLNAMVALYRPGPMAFIPEYIERKKNPARVKYLDPRMEHILKPTYGILIYQDDLLLIAVQLAGYSWGEADKLRKAVGKKLPEEMKKQKDRFTSGCIEHGMKPAVAKELWDQIETFAAYGFNKAHAASYGNLAYKTAYMKANFPVDYMAAVLTADAGDVEKIAEVVQECARMKIKILPPSVNESFGTFTVIDNSTIRFGLYSIKNFGTGVADSIIEARGTLSFKDMADFLSRGADPARGNASNGAGKNLNKKQLESLIECGALDALGERGALLASIDALLEFHRESGIPQNQNSLFGASAPQAVLKILASPAAPLAQKLIWEKELLGLYVSGHPLDAHREKLAKQKPLHETREKFPRGVETVIAGFLETISAIQTKNGERMLFGSLTDATGAVEIVAFPRVLKEYPALFEPGACLMLKGKFSDRNGQPSFVVDRAKAL